MIVVATENFRLYHEAVSALRERGVSFTTIEPADDPPDRAQVVITTREDEFDAGGRSDLELVFADSEQIRPAIETALNILRDGDGRTIVGIDPGVRPGVAVLVGGSVVAAFQVPLADAVDLIETELADATDPLVRIGDGARLQGAQLINDLEGVPIELVDETGTTPYLGAGARGMGDVLAAVNIAHMAGEPIDTREIAPTAGELQRIKDESRQRAPDNRSIDEDLARRVATGDLTVDEALSEHREA
ncbi:hypothetical protein ACNS7O_03965 [Haloferacaceae archaeon DSL9]